MADREMAEAGEFTEEELVFIGEDVCALYPSSTAWLAGEAARTAVLASDVTFTGVDYKDPGKNIPGGPGPRQAPQGQARGKGGGGDGASQRQE